ncbi:MAG: cytochrome c biogenesis heme-transporting ATPase CcmA [Chromatiales bacterium]|nr:cytochrome c biogenesis heme-transporting ATPase CcmA [Chromatiales bacterium]
MTQSNAARQSPSSPRPEGDLPPSLVARDLECVRDDRVLFTRLSFELRSGGILQLEGPNGSGKTSLLRILCGLRLPDAGEILWCGESTSDLAGEFHRDIAYVGHLAGIKRELTPLENLRVTIGLGRPRDGVDLEQALDEVGLYGFEDVPVRNLSAGQTRRVALARLLVARAKLWVLDEPFTALDRKGVAYVERLLERHTAEGGLIALTTHHTVNVSDTQVQILNLSEPRFRPE